MCVRACRASRGESDVSLHGSEQFPCSPPVEVQRGQRVASSTRQHHEVPAQRETSATQGVELRQGQRERTPVTYTHTHTICIICVYHTAMLNSVVSVCEFLPVSVMGICSFSLFCFTVLMTAQSGSYPGSNFVSSSPSSPSCWR